MSPATIQPDTPRNYMLAQEAFIRRAAAVGGPFMLKGSFVTRQYIANPAQRIPQDLDWVCLTPAQSEKQMRALLDAWATAVTEQPATDGFLLQSFRENTFWRMMDYAMSDDFPTVNTDIGVWLPGYSPATTTMLSLSVDVSFNLTIEPPPAPLIYQPIDGESFYLPQTCPLALQVAWKLHQTLVRPRYKDITDLILLLNVPAFDANTRQEAIQAFIDECQADKVRPQKLRYYLTEEVITDSRTFDQRESSWFQRVLNPKDNSLTTHFSELHRSFGYTQHHLGAGSKHYLSLTELFTDFRNALLQAGITPDLLPSQL